ncbi:MAG: hypothetical protein GY699_12620 [Desulfobacteraceae bacterium]|nr:hypothetical protein [Desulfobacteraceae bacterium]
MEYDLNTSIEKYIEVTVSGLVDKTGLIAAISELMNHPDYTQKNTLWNFYESSIDLNIGDLKEISEVLSFYKPEDKKFANKSAIVVPGEMHKAMVDLFISMSKFLPFKYKAFRDKEKAKAFLQSL